MHAFKTCLFCRQDSCCLDCLILLKLMRILNCSNNLLLLSAYPNNSLAPIWSLQKITRVKQ